MFSHRSTADRRDGCSRILVLMFSFTLAWGTATGRAADKSRQPNLLLVITDQQHAGMMSCTGNPWLKTPAMDRLAASGIRFERAYSANPVCVPARVSMMTGHFPSRFGMRSNAQARATTRGTTDAMHGLGLSRGRL